MKAIDKTNLGYLGVDYQYRLTKTFIEDAKFFQEIYPIVNQNAFTEPILRQFVRTLKEYFSTSGGVVPSYSTMKVLLTQEARMETDAEEIEEIVKTLQETPSEGWEAVKDCGKKFFLTQNVIKVANEVLQGAKGGEDPEELVKLMNGVKNFSDDDDEGFNPYDLESEVMTPNSTQPIPTGIKGLDDVLNGGLDKKKLGVVIGSAGFGKTTFSTAIASYASTCKNERNNFMGYKVLQFCFEDDPRDIAKKHFARITQVESKDLTKPQNVDSVKEALGGYEEKETFRENLLIKKYKPNTKGVADIDRYIKKKINAGFKPDLIIIDYFEPLKKTRSGKNDTKWDMEENCMREIECLAEDYNAAVWVMTQGNKDSFGAQIVTMNQAGGSVTKVQIGHVILSIARTLEDQLNNRATLTVLKSRQGGSGKVWEGIEFNNGTSTINCDEVIEYDSSLVYEEVRNEKQQESMTNYGQKIVESQSYRQGLQKKEVGNKDYFSQKNASDWEKGF